MIGALFALARPALRALGPETAHRAAILALRAAPLPRPRADDPSLGVRAFGIEFSNPVGMAAGFDKHAEALGGLTALGFGFVEAGGVTPLPQPGNPRPRVFRLEADHAIVNRYGLNSEGAERVARRMTARRAGGGIVGINLGANKDSADRAQDYVLLVRRFTGLADFLTVNVSSPNTPGLRDLQGEAALDALLARCIEARDEAKGARTPLLLKIAPDLTPQDLDAIVATARRRGVDGLVVANTTVARPASLREGRLSREVGGLSGRPLFEASTRLLAQTFERAEGAFPLVGVGGIDSAQGAWTKIEAGASLVQLYTAMVYKGPGLVSEIKAGLVERLAAEGLTSLSGVVGRRAADLAR